MKSLRQKFKDSKIKHKIMYIYIGISTIPILALGIFVYFQEHSILLERDERAFSDALNQGIEQLNSQIIVYNNLSDYICFDQPISEVLNGDYDNVYETYEQYTDTIDPVLSSLKYFNSNINQLTIYLDKDIVQHDTTVAPLRDIESKEWYKDNKSDISQSIRWIVDKDEKSAVSVRIMPILKQNNVDALMYLNVNYDNLFAEFEAFTQDEYGIYVLDENDNVLYESDNFGNDNDRKRLSASKLLSKYNEKKDVNYMFVSGDTCVDGWRVIAYKPSGIATGDVGILLLLVVGIVAICGLTSVVASFAFSKLIVGDIEKLRDNMQAVENGNMELTVESDSKDEIGTLIAGFGSMLSEINRLIHEVYESKLTLRKTEMSALQAQINPHFLYNSLSLINWKALEAGQEDISKITLALSSFYRTSLNRGKNVLTIEKELENMKSYLAIQSCMHDDEFDVSIDVDESIYPYKTLNLLLQPLVENAIDHGIDLKEDGRGYIKIIGRKDENKIYLIVEDNGIGIEQEVLDSIFELKTRGYGVRNVNERIQLYYGDEYNLKIESEVGRGTRCIITIPKRM